MAKEKKGHWLYFLLLGVLGAQYSVLSFISPTSVAERIYGITPQYFNLIKITFIIPIVLLWSLLLYGVLNINRYIQTIRESDDGRAFGLIGFGLLVLLVQAVSSSFINFINSYLTALETPALEIIKNLKILTNYSGVFYALLSFALFYLGTVRLVRLAKIRENIGKSVVVVVVVVLVGLAYTYLVLQNPVRQISTNPRLSPTYYLSDIMIFTTIILPYLAAWLMGGLAIVNLFAYEKSVKGVIYKQALKSFSRGFIAIVILSIGVQFLNQLGANLVYAGLNTLLLIIYALLIFIGVGYWMMARGAQRLTMIEEIV